MIDPDSSLIPELDASGLRRFGLTTGLLLAALFGLLVPWVFGREWPLWPWLLGAALGGWALLAPGTLRPVYRAWMWFGLLLSRITNPIILGIVYFVVFTPIALVMRLFGRDILARKLRLPLPSYRCPSRKRPRTHMERPF